MAKYLVILAIFTVVGMQVRVSARKVQTDEYAAELPTNATPITLPSIQGSLTTTYTCVYDDLMKFKDEALTALKSNPAGTICGPNTVKKFTVSMAVVTAKAKTCKSISCYVGILPIIQGGLQELATQCTAEFKAIAILSTQAFKTISQCIVNPVANSQDL